MLNEKGETPGVLTAAKYMHVTAPNFQQIALAVGHEHLLECNQPARYCCCCCCCSPPTFMVLTASEKALMACGTWHSRQHIELVAYCTIVTARSQLQQPEEIVHCNGVG